MAKLVFRLKGVFEDEADEVRSLLREHDIDFYETSAGNWGISMPGLWVRNNSDYEHARALIDTYQQERSKRIRAEYDEQRNKNLHESLGQRLANRPVEVILYLAFIVLILYFSLAPFFSLGH